MVNNFRCPMTAIDAVDGSYFLVALGNHTLAHCDVGRWEPSTASIAVIPVFGNHA